MRSWPVVAAAVTLACACERPHVVPAQADPSVAADRPFTLATRDEAQDVVDALIAARNRHDANAVEALYAASAHIQVFRGTSSWLLSPTRWARQGTRPSTEVSLLSLEVVQYRELQRVVAVLDERTPTQHLQTLHVFRLRHVGQGWMIDMESQADSIDMARPLSGYSRPVLADLSYREHPDLAILRVTGASDTEPELGWSGIEHPPCPNASCTARLDVDLLLIGIDGDKLQETHVEGHREACARIPAVELGGAVQVYERAALIVGHRGLPCAGDDAWRPTSVIGVRGQGLETLLTLERSRVMAVDEGSLTIQHSHQPGSPPTTVRFIPQKDASHLFFRAEEDPEAQATSTRDDRSDESAVTPAEKPRSR